ILFEYLPPDKWSMTVADWFRWRKELSAMAERLLADAQKHPAAYTPESQTPEAIERRKHSVVLARNDHATDAWDHEVLVSFSDAQRQALIVSVGPDGQKGTDDDVLLLAKGRRTFEDNELHWTYDKNWQIPEGLGALVENRTDAHGSVSFKKIIAQ